MMTSTPIMDRLRLETSEAHKRAESQELEKALVKGALPKETYAEYIAQRYVIHVQLEKALQALAQADPRVRGVVTEDRIHSVRAAKDLEQLGRNAANVSPLAETTAMAEYVKSLATPPSIALLGVFYVFEGSTNGAKYISMALRRSYGFEGTFGTNYLDPYGDQQRALWAAFKESVNAQEFTDAEQEAILAGATETFHHIANIDNAIHAAMA